MKISEALQILQAAGDRPKTYSLSLVCGFTPLHLKAFTAAHLAQRLPDMCATVTTGLFGDVAGTLENAPPLADAFAIALEWQDLDPRLGFRGLGLWGPSVVADIEAAAAVALNRIGSAIERLPAGVPVACSLPTLPLPPLVHTPGWHMSDLELALDSAILDFARKARRRSGLSIVNSRRLAENSPASARFNLNADLSAALPYTISHADAVGAALADLLAPPPPKKGVITDLDDTLWGGVVGEIGPDNISWDLAGHHQLHGLYQNLLGALAAEGVLIGIASKNDPAVVERALARPDMLLRTEAVFPIEVHWNAKSGSVDRILKSWNIGADSVVFVDDNPMELAEVAAAHPGIRCVRFPAQDPAAGMALLRCLRDLCGKTQLSEEDALRLQSLRRNAPVQHAAAASSLDAFLESAGATLTIDFNRPLESFRVLELVNKTNQFNLNGIRRSSSEWTRRLQRPDALLAVIDYQDRFGPLGRIAVLEGRLEAKTLYLETWVMSCRAFSRRIEHQCLRTLFDFCGLDRMVFEFSATMKNRPLQDFFATIAAPPASGLIELTNTQFREKCPPLYHQVIVTPSKSSPCNQLQPA